MPTTIHPSAIVDPGAQLGEDCRVWHFVHVSAGARIGARCSLGQNVFVGNDVRIGDNVKIQNNVSVYDAVTLEDDVFCGPSMVFTNVYNPRAAVSRKDEYRRTLVQARRHAGRQLHHRVRRDDRPLCLRRRRRGGQPRRAGLRADGRRAGAADRLDEPPWRAPGAAAATATAEPSARQPASAIVLSEADVCAEAERHERQSCEFIDLKTQYAALKDRIDAAHPGACSTTASTSWAPRSRSSRTGSRRLHRRAGTASPWPAAPRRC